MMNERIKELMLEAGYAAPEIALRAQRLAELIVRDCARICQEQTDDSDATTWADVCAVSILKEYGL